MYCAHTRSVLGHSNSKRGKDTVSVYKDIQRREMDKIEINGQEKAETLVGAGRKRKDDKEDRVEGYTFLWLKNTLSFNKGTYIPLYVI